MDKILRQFVEVADCQSINMAAKNLKISQPALSRNMQRLEENFGKPLLLRASSGIRLTQYGEILYRRAQIMELEYQYVLEEFKVLDGVHDGVIRIGSGYDWSLGRLPTVIYQLTEIYRDLNFHIQNGCLENLLDDISAGKLDIVLAEILPAGQLSNAIIFKPIREVRWKIFTHHNHIAQQDNFDTINKLNQFPWAAYNEKPIRLIDTRRIFDRNRIKRPKMTYTSNSILTIFHLIQANPNVITCLPAEIGASALKFGLKPLDVKEDLPSYSAGIYYRSSAMQVPFFKEFIDILQKEYNKEETSFITLK